MKYSIWEDAIYSVTGTSYLVYNLYNEDSELIYTGKAYPRPNVGTIEINISQIVRNYLNSQLPLTATSGSSIQEGQFYLPYAVLGFSLTDDKGNELESYKFLNCWDYETKYANIDILAGGFNINQQVNNHFATGQYFFNSLLTKQDKVRVTISMAQPNSCGYGALYYSNALGGWDSFLIEGNLKKKNTYTKYEIDNAYRADTLQFGHRTINNTISESWELQTQYLTDEESKKLALHLFGSNNVYFHDFTDNKIYPVVITDSSVEVKTWRNQKRSHFLHKINIKSAQDKMRI